MPPYPSATITALKDTLRCRRDAGYDFTPEDVDTLQTGTGLERAKIIEWAHNVRQFYATSERMERFFSGVQEVSYTYNIISYACNVDETMRVKSCSSVNRPEFIIM